MDVTPLELAIATAVLFIAFGPKKLPRFGKNSGTAAYEVASYAPSRYAAGRAPSPLQTAAARRAAKGEYQFAMVDATGPNPSVRPAPLPHELPHYGA